MQSISHVRLDCLHGGEGRLARVGGRKHCKHVKRKSLDSSEQDKQKVLTDSALLSASPTKELVCKSINSISNAT